ncbi:hypothetical protein O3W44_22215 [Pantoea sp. LMR881]|uniref:hypothetical protein n=1 Tax=Pantoea sp. LMR881 TaxID=3014336 RepID=UPI0022AE6E3F|nr:hypothetical protein [Pantoea sp. LMR881]MCZ4061248.1 hypothetical protein [Pantoea sp. LMR881]
MKDYLKSIWDNFSSHMLFLYLGAFIFIQLDIWFFGEKIEPATFTATASTVTLLLALYSLTRWESTKTSEKAFERTSKFIENIYRIFRLNKIIHACLYETDQKLENMDKSLYDQFLSDAAESIKQARSSYDEALTLHDSFLLGRLHFKKNQSLKNSDPQ